MNGHPQSVTPNLDRLAERGTVFTNAYCNAVQCSPSRLSLLSGKLPDYTGIYQAGQYNDADLRSNFGGQPHWFLPEIMKDTGGYFTAVTNKVFHGKRQNPPFSDIDLDESTTDDCARGKSWSRYLELPSNTAEPDAANTYGFEGTNYIWGQVDDSRENATEDFRAAKNGLDFLQEYSTNPSAFCDRPFFLAIGIFRPHTPFFSPAKYWLDDFNADFNQFPFEIPYNDPPNAFPPNGIVMAPQPDSAFSDYENLPFLGKVNANGSAGAVNARFDTFGLSIDPLPLIAPGLDSAARLEVIAESTRAGAMAGYLAGVRYADAMIGRFIDGLDSDPALREKTIIVLVSDHGYHMREKRHWGKVTNWDQGTRIPFIIIDPRRPGKQVVQTPVSLIDVFPTVLDLTEVEAPTLPGGDAYLDGESLVPYLDNPELESRTPAISAVGLSGSYVDGNCFPHYGVRYGRWHYLRYLTNGAEDSAAVCSFPQSRIQEELYEIGVNREVDPNEWNNLANNPDYRGVMDFLADMLPPDGKQAYGPSAYVEIVRDGLDCAINLNDTTEFSLRYTDVNGTVYTDSVPGVVFVWSAPSMSVQQVGPVGRLRKNVLDTAVLNSRERIALTLRAIDTVNETYVEDMVLLSFRVEDAPSADLQLSYPSANSVAVMGSSSGLVRSVAWDFGDGFSTTETDPAPHSYSSAGTYALRYELFYGNDPDALCFERIDTTVVIPDSVFAMLPCQTPYPPQISEIGSRQVKASWRPVQNATLYDYRYRKQDDPLGAWSTATKTSNFDVVKPLQPNLALELQVRAVCSGSATDTSAWSRPSRFRTRACYAPINTRIDSVGSDWVEYSFDPQNQEMIGHEAFIRPALGGPFQREILNDVYNVSFTGLFPDTEYQFAVRVYCPDKNGNPFAKGPFGTIGSFRTLPTGLPKQAEASEMELELAPNPASDWVRVRLEGEGQIRILDALGSLHWSGQNAGNSLELDVSEWPVGWYTVEWVGQDGERQQHALVVSR
jgi:arylsulfatase A-like enzyme